jgi:hypothetical protein
VESLKIGVQPDYEQARKKGEGKERERGRADEILGFLLLRGGLCGQRHHHKLKG